MTATKSPRLVVGNEQLSDADVMTIFSDTTRSQKELAHAYGVSQGQISRIKSGKSWGWLTGKLPED
jgi:predicted transcriptional regulator